MYDIYYFSLTSSTSDLPGLLVTAAPRKADRRRQRDVLAVLLTLKGQHPLDSAGQKGLIQKLVETYFATSKTVTAGIRLAVESLNAYLLERNRAGARDGWAVTALLNLAIQHENRIYVAHVGPTHTFFLGHHDVFHWEENGNAQALGMSTQINLRFYSEEIEAGDLLLFSPRPPASWTPAALQGSPALTFDHLRRRLMNQAGPTLESGVIQFKSGVGEIHAMRLRPVSRPMVVDTPPIPAPEPPLPAAEISPPEPGEPFAPPPPSAEEMPDQPPLDEVQPSAPTGTDSTPAPLGFPQPEQDESFDSFPPLDADEQPAIPNPPPAASVAPSLAAPSTASPNSITSPRPSQRPLRSAGSGQQLPLPEPGAMDDTPAVQNLQRRRPARSSNRRQVAGIWLAGRSLRQKVSGIFQRLFWRMLPTQGTQQSTFPLGWLWFIAVVIPLLVVAIALTIYTQLGSGENQQIYLQQARQVALQAMNEADLAKQRQLWDQTLELLAQAEEYGQNSETRQLHNDINAGLDEIDKVKRLSFVETMRSRLADTVNISRMVSHGNDVYALDSDSGAVLRFVGASGQYDVDEKFICGPRNYNGVIVTPVVDMIPLPNGIQAGATVLAVDESGNLMYCGPNVQPIIQTLTPPEGYLGKVAGIAQSGKVLLVLDKGRNMIWRYGDPRQEDDDPPSESLVNWTQNPRPYFQQNPPALSSVVDFVVQEDLLYLLDASGQTVFCSYSSIDYSPTSCQSPAEYEDPRPGRQNKVTLFEGTLFTRLAIDPLNRQSLYILDQNKPAVYRLSLRLYLDKVFEPTTSSNLPEGQPSAFVVTNNQYLLLAYGNRLFTARP